MRTVLGPSVGCTRRSLLRAAVRGAPALGMAMAAVSLAACGQGAAVATSTLTAAATTVSQVSPTPSAPATTATQASATSSASVTTQTTTTAAISASSGVSTTATSLASSASAPAQAAAAPGGAGQLVWWDWNPPGKAYQSYIDWIHNDFQAANSKVNVQFVQVAFGQYIDKLIATEAGGDPPDALMLSVIHGHDLFLRGLLRDLTAEFGRTPSMAPSNYIDAALIYNQVQGKMFAAFMYADARSLVFNVDRFHEAAIDSSPEATAKWTWDDFVANIGKMTLPGQEHYGYAILQGISRVEQLDAWLYTNGASFYSADFSKLSLDTPNAIETLNYVVDLEQKKGVPDVKGQPGEWLFTGKTAMMDFGSLPFNFMADSAPKDFKYSMMLYPKGPHGSAPATVAWYNMMGVPTGAKHPDVSWDFLSFSGSLKSHVQQFLLEKRPSPRKDLYTTKEFTDAAKASPPIGLIQPILSAGGAYPFVHYSDVVSAVTKPLDQAFAGTMGVTDAIKQAQSLGDVALQKAP